MDPQLAEVGTKQFSSHQVTIGGFYDDIIRGDEYDLDPSHQRKIVHNNKWRSEVIKSLLKGMPIGQPEFDTQVKSNGLTIKRSIDGKQRCLAPIMFLNNEYKYTCKWPTAMSGKYFNDTPEIWQQKLRQQPFEICVTRTHLTEKEISEHFIKKQDTKKTSLGEKLNASQHQPTVIFCKNIISSNPLLINELFNENTRYKTLEVIVRMVYACQAFKHNKKPDPGPKTIVESISKIPDNSWTNIIINCLLIVKECESNYKFSNTWILPLLALIYKNKDGSMNSPIATIHELKTFVIEVVDVENFYNEVGACHSATDTRIKQIIVEWEQRG